MKYCHCFKLTVEQSKWLLSPISDRNSTRYIHVLFAVRCSPICIVVVATFFGTEFYLLAPNTFELWIGRVTLCCTHTSTHKQSELRFSSRAFCECSFDAPQVNWYTEKDEQQLAKIDKTYITGITPSSSSGNNPK